MIKIGIAYQRPQPNYADQFDEEMQRLILGVKQDNSGGIAAIVGGVLAVVVFLALIIKGVA